MPPCLFGSSRDSNNLELSDVGCYSFERSRQENVAVVSARVFLEVILVIGFRGVEIARGSNLGNYGAFETAGLIQALFDAFGCSFLFFGMVENGGAVLGPNVVVLAVRSGGIMHAKEVVEDGLV